MSRFVHRGVDTDHYRATQFDPPFPAAVPGNGYPAWTLPHRGHALYFASPAEMAHVAEALGQRVLPKPRVLGAEQAAVNSHWLSRMDKGPAKLEGAVVLGEAFARLIRSITGERLPISPPAR